MISVLYNYQNRADRYLVADDLACFDEHIVREALIHIAGDPREELELREVCAASLAEICWRNQIKEIGFIEQMSPSIKSTFENEYFPLLKSFPNGPPDNDNPFYPKKTGEEET